jgi:GTP cyclohydrolase I
MKTVVLTQPDILRLAQRAVDKHGIGKSDNLWGVPRGGVAPAIAISGLAGCALGTTPDFASIIIDDLRDSGATEARYHELYPNKEFIYLIDKRDPLYSGKWVQFPWEVNDAGDEANEKDIVRRLIQYVGEDPDREGLQDTPTRVLKAWREWCSGYGRSPEEVLKTFKDGAEGVNELVVMHHIRVQSICEHHLAPFFGEATIGYIPDGRIVGLSKLVRLTEIFARRLQTQERLTGQIADALMDNLMPRGAGVIVKCRHMCMESRGVRSPGTPTTTSALRGVLFDDPRARSEFLQLNR